MLVYTTLFTLKGKEPRENKYLTMFYMWFTYLKRYSGLGSNDCVGLIVDEDTFDFMNSDGNQIFSYLSEGVPFNIEISIMPRPANLTEGFAERYRAENFENFTKHELNLHIDIDCLCIRNIHKLFFGISADFYAMEEDGLITDDNYAGHFIKDKIYDEQGISAGWYAWTHTEEQRAFFEAVSKGCLENSPPFYTVDQPFYNYELFKRKDSLNIHRFNKHVVAFNPLFFDSRLATAYFVNFAGEPGVEQCHFDKMFSFMCVDFSTVSQDKIQNSSELSIDSSSYIMNPYTILSYDSRKKDGKLPIIQIGKKCSIAANCTFSLSNHLTDTFSTSVSTRNLFLHKQGNPSSYSKGDIIIKNDVWIGTNVTVLDGITIGNGAVIAAGSVVVKDVPPYAIVGGNPAKLIKYRFSQDIIDDLEAICFWDLSIEQIEKFDIHTRDIKDFIEQVRVFRRPALAPALAQQQPLPPAPQQEQEEEHGHPEEA